MRINQGKDITVKTDPLSFAAGLSVLNGTPDQAYDQQEKSYSPSRKIDNLVIKPWVNITGEGVEACTDAAIQDVKYYAGDATKKVDITTYTGYSVKDTILTVTADTPADSPMLITAVITFVDPRDNGTYACERDILLQTSYFVAHQWRVELNRPSLMIVDPTRATRNEDDDIPLPVQCTLYDNGNIVRDSSEETEEGTAAGETYGNVAYFWQYLDADGDLVDVDKTCHWLLTEFDEEGHLPGTIVVNGDCFDSLKLRCYATSYATGDVYPSRPTANQWAECCMKRELPATAWAETICDQGSFITSPLSEEPIKLHVVIHDNESEISNVDKYYRVYWYAQSHATGSTAVKIGEGYSIETTAVALGLTRAQGARVYPVIYELGAYLPISAGVGQTVEGYTVPILITTDNGEYICAQKIKVK